MPRPLVALAAVPLLLAVAPAAPVPKGATAAPYFPTKLNAKWVYWSEASRSGSTEVVTAVEQKGGASIVSVGQEVDGEVRPYVTVSASSTGLFLVGRDGGAIDPPSTILKLPAKPGDTWDAAGVPGPGVPLPNGTYTVKGEEDIEVPAGKYRAVRVDAVVPYKRGSKIERTLWYAPGIGRVKSVIKLNGQEQEEVLKSFTPGKD